MRPRELAAATLLALGSLAGVAVDSSATVLYVTAGTAIYRIRSSTIGAGF